MSAIITGVQAILVIIVAMAIPGGMALLGTYLFRKYKTTPTKMAYINDVDEVDAFIDYLNQDVKLRTRLFWILMPISVIGFLVGLLIGLSILGESLLTLIQL